MRAVLSLCLWWCIYFLLGEASAAAAASMVGRDDDEYLDVTEFGAVGDGVTEDTSALRRVISLCSRGTIVHLPAHRTFVSAPLNLSSNVILQVDGRLEAITNTTKDFASKWPQIPPLVNYAMSEDNGRYLQYQSFLYASGSSNIAIRGNGTIDGMGPWWWDSFRRHSSSLPAGRPNLIQFVNCTNVEITGVTFKDSPFWTVHPVLSSDVYIHHVSIRAPLYAPNIDGIDPDSSQNVLIEYNDISCGDDHIAIKAGRCGMGDSMMDRIRCQDDDNFANGHYETSNVVIRYNTLRTGMGIALGSEISGGVRDIYIHDNVIGLCEHGTDDTSERCGWGHAQHLKTTLTRGGYLRNILFQNVIYNTTGFFLIETDYQSHNHSPASYPTTEIKNISIIGNLGLGQATGWTLGCSESLPCKEILVQDNWVMHGTSKSYRCSHVDTYREDNNYPPGLGDCLYHSVNRTDMAIIDVNVIS